MTYTRRILGKKEYKFFELEIALTEDIKSISKYVNEENVAVSLTWLKFIGMFRNIRRLVITDGTFYGNIEDILSRLTAVRELQIERLERNENFVIDLSLLPSVEYLDAYSSRNFINADRCPNLKTVVINRCYEKDLLKLSGSRIDCLEIDHGKLRTLEGIESLPLKVLAVREQPELSDIARYLPSSLKMLEITFCRRINGFKDPFPSGLEYLIIDGRNHYENISFIRSIQSLKRAVIGVFIDDCDLSPLMGLENAVVLRKNPQYNAVLKQLPKSDRQYLSDDIPVWRYIYSDMVL